MSEGGSSPFIENPEDVSREEVFRLRQVVSLLRFDLDALETEREIWKKDKEILSNKYEKLILQKNEELEEVQNDFDFLYKQRDELRSKLSNLDQVNERNVSQLREQLETSRKENRRLREVNTDLEQRVSESSRRLQRLEADLAYERSSKLLLQERINHLEETNQGVSKANDDLLHRLQEVSEQFVSSASDKYSRNLQERNDLLGQENAELSSKLDKLLQQKISGEVWRQKTLSLTKKLETFEELEERCCRLEIENLELTAKFDSYFKLIAQFAHRDDDKTTEADVLNFLDSYRLLQNEALVLQDKFNQASNAHSELELEISQLQERNNDHTVEIGSLRKLLKEKEEYIDKLERQKVLNSREIDYLKKKINQSEDARLKDKKAEKESNDLYLTNLEKLVEEYRNEINSLQKQIEPQKLSGVNMADKRPRLINEEASTNLRMEYMKLEKENVKLQSTIKSLEDKTAELESRVKMLGTADTKKQQLHILQLKSNPAWKDQQIKQSTLEHLMKENKDLLAALSGKEGMQALIPRSVFERQEHDKKLLQDEIQSLDKRNKRLKEIYTQKSRDILSVISKFFGYTIEFIPSTINPNDLSRIKLVSRYMSNKNEANPFLTLDLNSKSLKANGNLKFKSMCEELVATWVKDKNQIPCFLSALTLNIYEQYGSME